MALYTLEEVFRGLREEGHPSTGVLSAKSVQVHKHSRGGVSCSALQRLVLCAICVLFLAPTSLGQQTAADGALFTVVVSDCVQMRRELERNVVDKVVVRGILTCDKESWGSELVVSQDITVTGKSDRGGDQGYGLIDWGDSQGLLIAGGGAHIRFEEVILLQQNVGLGGFHFTFFDTDDVSQGTFAGVVLGVATCPSSLTYDKKLRKSSKDTVFLNNAVLQGPGRRSSWQICTSVQDCGVTRDDVSFLQELIANEEINSECTLERSLPREGEKGSPLMLIILSATFLAVIGLVILAAVLCIRYKKNHASRRGLSLDLERGTEETDVDGSSSSRSLVQKGPSVRPWTFRMSDVQLADPLGRGSFGKVYKGFWQGTAVAIKTIMHGRSFLEKEGEPFEAYLNRHVSHPNVVQTFLIHTWSMAPSGSTADVSSSLSDTMQQASGEDPTPTASVLMSTDDVFGSIAKGPAAHDGEVFETWIVLEYCDRGSLAKAIRKGVFMGSNPRRPDMRHVLLTALDVGYAVNYLHSVRIIHGDLKAENVLLKSDSSDPRSFVCKVGDFGLSRFLAEDTHIETFTYGTITHMPPELLKGGVLTPAADMYSFGVLLWELLTGLRPYATKNHGEIVLAVVNESMRPPIPDFCPPEFKELLQDCWRHSYQERPSFPEVIDRLKGMLEMEHRAHRPAVSPTQTLTIPYSTSPKTGDSWIPEHRAHPIELVMTPGFWSVDSEPLEDQIPTRGGLGGFSAPHTHHQHHIIESNPALSSVDSGSPNAPIHDGQMFDYQHDGQTNPCFMMTTQMTKTVDSQTTNMYRINSGGEHTIGYQNTAG
ncbi:hypothetical protein BSKO_05316 [Bryopsis sp. KO-2023]|nr:hypothetical protein BSKO_05316 [Bryopsis sp. KO-2023]